MRGYGSSSCPRDHTAYRLERLVAEQLALLQHLGRSEAVWIGHDWGSGVVSALAAHHPEVFAGMILLSLPYRTIELGVDHLITLVNRELYPESEYPYGQWAYMKLYEKAPEKADRNLESSIKKTTKLLYAKSDPETFGKPSFTANAMRDEAFFPANPDDLPDIPLEYTSLDETLFNNLVKTHKENGYFPATAYYRNHKLNEAYDKSKKDDGVLQVPVLYIDPKYDAVCSSSTTPKMLDGMRKTCKQLTERSIEAAHWVQLEKPEEVNATIAEWLATSMLGYWPWHGQRLFAKV